MVPSVGRIRQDGSPLSRFTIQCFARSIKKIIQKIKKYNKTKKQKTQLVYLHERSIKQFISSDLPRMKKKKTKNLKSEISPLPEAVIYISHESVGS